MLPLTDGVITLGRLRASDAAAHIAGTPKAAAVWWPPHPGADAVRAWIAADADAWESHESERVLSIRVRGGLVGGVELRVLTDEIAEVSYWVFPEHRGNGYSERAVRLVVPAIGAAFAVQTVQLRIDERNYPSLVVARNLGFREVERGGGDVLFYGSTEAS